MVEEKIVIIFGKINVNFNTCSSWLSPDYFFYPKLTSKKGRSYVGKISEERGIFILDKYRIVILPDSHESSSKHVLWLIVLVNAIVPW